MDNDLSDVGLEALEALEAQDEQENSNQEGGEEKDTGETNNTSENENETNTEVNSDEEDDNKSDETDNEEDNNDTEDEKSDVEKKELSEEEFEEMAKKRGYAKEKSEEEKKQIEEKQNSERANMEKLVACPKEIEEDVWEELPIKNKIIYNSLPYITVSGKDGDIKVKTPDQLPDDFEFASKKAEAKFYNEIQAQEAKASQMDNALEQRRANNERVTAQREEARLVVSQIEKLQKSGELPTPKAKSGTKEFDSDPAVIAINKVLNYRANRAREGVNLSVRDSLLLYKAEHPEEFEKKEAKGDVERKNVAKKVAGNSKSSGTAVNKDDDKKPQYYKVGMSTEDVLDRILDDME